MSSLLNRFKYLFWGLAILWTGIIIASVAWNFHLQKEKIFEVARNSAYLAFEKDVLYRSWVAQHGGVYVPVSNHTPPNPYIRVPERDIFTSSGSQLTLVNPAYMTRQVNEMSANIHSRSKITSLHPLRPQNSPDSWETSALKSFEEGSREVSSIDQEAGEEHMRVMRPLITEETCLKCHASQGYKAGDIRGGISISIPMGPLWAIERPFLNKISLAHLLLWIGGLTGIWISQRTLVKQILAREIIEEELRKSRDELNFKVQERTAELLQANETLRNLPSKILSFHEHERKRIAYEVHDALGSSLMAVKLKADEALENLAKDGNSNVSKPLETLDGLVRETIGQARRIQSDLWPPLLDDLGLVATLSWFCRRFETIYPGIRLEQRIDIREDRVSDALKTAIFRVIQEALNSVAKRSQADRLSLSLEEENNKIELTISDNGMGFEMEEVLSQEKSLPGLGLVSMRERTELSGGSLSIQSARGQGTVIRASWPDKVLN